MPYHLSRQTMKNAQRAVEHTSTHILKDLTAAQKSSTKSNPEKTLSDLDAMLSRLQTLKRKLEVLHDEETKWNRASKARIQHLQTLYEVHSLADVKYEAWSRTRAARLLVDYLLRSGYLESARSLAKGADIEDLVDVEAFVAAHRIEKSLREDHDTGLALNWCLQNQQALRKMGGRLEFELRLQQYVELVREGHMRSRKVDEGGDGHMGELRGGDGDGEEKLVEARAHAKKYLSGMTDLGVLGKAAGLLAYRPWDPVEPYAVCVRSRFHALENRLTNESYSPYTPTPAGPRSPNSS